MSRIGQKPIIIPNGTEVKTEGLILTVKGPKGELKREFRDDISIAIEGSEITVRPKKESNFSRALWGTYASHIINMIAGVNEGFTKKLAVEGVGYRATMEGNDLVLAVGFSHPVRVVVPPGVEATTEKNTITIIGINKEDVGQFAAKVRAIKKPEPYKGKGIRYEGEVIRRKQGKKAIA